MVMTCCCHRAEAINRCSLARPHPHPSRLPAGSAVRIKMTRRLRTLATHLDPPHRHHTNHASAALPNEPEVPVVDLSEVIAANGLGDLHARMAAVRQIRDACATWGFFQVVNHGVAGEQVQTRGPLIMCCQRGSAGALNLACPAADVLSSLRSRRPCRDFSRSRRLRRNWCAGQRRTRR